MVGSVRGIACTGEEMLKGSADTKRIILGALAAVARDVAAEMDEESEREGEGRRRVDVSAHTDTRAGASGGGTDGVLSRGRRSRDEGVKVSDGERENGGRNMLRESVRAWMSEVKAAAASAGASSSTGTGGAR